jgi:hypothetical protein
MNLWHALPEHGTLGGINRVRGIAYGRIARFVYDQNTIHDRTDRRGEVLMSEK